MVKITRLIPRRSKRPKTREKRMPGCCHGVGYDGHPATASGNECECLYYFVG